MTTEVSMPPKTAGDTTKERILDAAFDTLVEDGITGASARAIAAHGEFNQALIFYHFGSVRELLIATIERSSQIQVERYRERIEGITDLGDMVHVAAALHAEDMERGSITMVAQLMAGAASDPEMGEAVVKAFQPWIDLVERALRQVFAGSPIEVFLPYSDMAYGISSLFLGLELLSKLDPNHEQDERIFSMMTMVSGMLENVIAGKPLLG
ncbi:MAG: TetR/AcrR family transcriptional regulator [Acidimicrobiia bacterium]|nr:TetR/AcrR family transcriptional regulator [Acidimicrobiia bacterium]MDH5504563.1 TetR/AcrR family transcriptional regulator [Acidimicrobiia bacterium]